MRLLEIKIFYFLFLGKRLDTIKARKIFTRTDQFHANV